MNDNARWSGWHDGTYDPEDVPGMKSSDQEFLVVKKSKFTFGALLQQYWA